MSVGQLESLDNTISTNGIRSQNFSQCPYRLMMGAVHTQPGNLHNLVQQRLRKNFHFMDNLILGVPSTVLNCARHLGGDIGIQGAS